MLGLLGGGLNIGASGMQLSFNLLQAAFSFVTRGFMALGALLTGVVVGGLTTFVAALKSATTSAMEYSRAVINLRNATGMSTGAAQRASNRFGAFGIGPDALANGGQHHSLTALMGRAFGVNPFDPASINARSQSFGGGLMGHMMRRSMLSSIGMDTEQGRFLANLPQERVREQLGYQSRIQGALGITPENMRRFAEDLPLVTARIGMVVDAIKMKFAATLLPIVERTLGRVADYLAKHSGTIGNVIERAGKWLMEDLPPMILRGAISFLTGAGHLLKGFGEFTSGLVGQVPAFLTVLDTMINGIRTFVGFVGGAANVIMQAGRRLVFGGAPATSTGAPGGASTPAPSGGGAFDRVRDAIGQGWKMYQDASNPYSSRPGMVQNGFFDGVARIGSRLAPRIGQFLGRAEQLGAGAEQFGARVGQVANRAGRAGRGAVRVGRGLVTVGTLGAAGYGAYQLGNLFSGATDHFAAGRDATLARFGESNLAGDEDLENTISGVLRRVSGASNAGGDRLLQMAATLEASLRELQKGNSIAERTEQNTRDASQKMGSFRSDTINRVLSYIAEDTLLANLGG